MKPAPSYVDWHLVGVWVAAIVCVSIALWFAYGIGRLAGAAEAITYCSRTNR